MSRIPVAQPEWLEGGVEQMAKTISLYKKGLIPESIQGWMFVVDCMRLLRAVYGDDLTTATEIRRFVLAKEEVEAAYARRSTGQP